MQKWEYLELELEIAGPLLGSRARVKQFKVNGKHEEYEAPYGTLMADLGVKGWELVAGSARTGTGLSAHHKVNYIFKRPLHE